MARETRNGDVRALEAEAQLRVPLRVHVDARSRRQRRGRKRPFGTLRTGSAVAAAKEVCTSAGGGSPELGAGERKAVQQAVVALRSG